MLETKFLLGMRNLSFVILEILCIVIFTCCKGDDPIAYDERICDKLKKYHSVYHASNDCSHYRSKAYLKSSVGFNEFIKYKGDKYCEFCVDDDTRDILDLISQRNQNRYIEVVDSYFSSMSSEDYERCKMRIDKFDR